MVRFGPKPNGEISGPSTRALRECFGSSRGGPSTRALGAAAAALPRPDNSPRCGMCGCGRCGVAPPSQKPHMQRDAHAPVTRGGLSPCGLSTVLPPRALSPPQLVRCTGVAKRAESSCRLALASATHRVFVAVSSRGQAVAALGSISAGASRALGGPRGLQPRAKRPARGHRRLVGAAAAASVLLLRRAWGGGRADSARRRSNPAARLVRSTP